MTLPRRAHRVRTLAVVAGISLVATGAHAEDDLLDEALSRGAIKGLLESARMGWGGDAYWVNGQAPTTVPRVKTFEIGEPRRLRDALLPYVDRMQAELRGSSRRRDLDNSTTTAVKDLARSIEESNGFLYDVHIDGHTAAGLPSRAEWLAMVIETSAGWRVSAFLFPESLEDGLDPLTPNLADEVGSIEHDDPRLGDKVRHLTDAIRYMVDGQTARTAAATRAPASVVAAARREEEQREREERDRHEMARRRRITAELSAATAPGRVYIATWNWNEQGGQVQIVFDSQSEAGVIRGRMQLDGQDRELVGQIEFNNDEPYNLMLENVKGDGVVRNTSRQPSMRWLFRDTAFQLRLKSEGSKLVGVSGRGSRDTTWELVPASP